MPFRKRRPKYKGRGKRRVGAEKFRYRHRKGIAVLLSLILVVCGAGAAFAYVLNSKLNNIARIPTPTVQVTNRPDPDQGKALNILLLGSDAGKGAGGGNSGGASVKEALAKPEWPSGAFRSDSMMVVHISADRKSVYLVSIPRDSLIRLFDGTGSYRYTSKANAAFSFYGPNGALSTMEQLTNIRMNHMTIIDWIGFRDLSTALGGVRVCIPESFYDSGQKIQWKKGCQNLKGKKALAYVRTRHGLTKGDFGRIERQQNFLRATMEKLLSKGTFTNPIRLTNVLDAITKNIVIDEAWETGDIRALALSMRNVTSKNVKFMTMPIAGYGNDKANGSYLRVDEAKAKELWTALKDDDVETYLTKYPKDVLGKAEDVE